MSNLMSEESLNSYPILRSDESSVSKHLLIIYPFVRGLLLILLGTLGIQLTPLLLAKDISL